MTTSFKLNGDHPRGCGEHPLDLPDDSETLGSSPRMRGALSSSTLCAMYWRIIPADAGSTRRSHGSGPPRWDHPRGCGEHGNWWRVYGLGMGSSPRMRGALSDSCSLCYGMGIIPADAGSTILYKPINVFNGDHPSGCGEHPIGG